MPGNWSLLGRLEALVRDPSTDASNWHRSVILGFPFACLAFLSGWLFDAVIGSADPFDAWAYPIMTTLAASLWTLFVLDRHARRHTTILTLLLLFGNGLFFASKLAFIVLHPGEVIQLNELTETFYWLPALYIVAANANRTPVGRRFCELLLLFNLGITVVQGLQPDTLDQRRVVFALVQMLLANCMLYFLTLTTTTFERSRARRLQEMALTDTLTGLANRLGLENELGLTVEAAREREEVFSLLFLDLNGFKAVNDTLGHETGDVLLREVAARLNPLRRGTDVLARLGGDEFVMLARGAARPAAEDIAARIHHAMSQPFAASKGLTVGASIGLAAYPADGHDAATLLATADARMYEVKRARKAGGGADGLPANRLDVRQSLARAQMRLTPCQNRPTLLRLAGPQDSVTSPEEICRSALLDGEGLPLLHWWAGEVAARLSRPGPLMPDTSFSVPLSLLDPRLADVLLAALEREDVAASRLRLAIPALALHPDEKNKWPVLSRLVDTGVRVELEDATPQALTHVRMMATILHHHDHGDVQVA